MELHSNNDTNALQRGKVGASIPDQEFMRIIELLLCLQHLDMQKRYVGMRLLDVELS